MGPSVVTPANRGIGLELVRRLKPPGIAVIMIDPGIVRTEMTRRQGMIDAEESARELLRCSDELRLETTCRFLHQKGEFLPR